MDTTMLFPGGCRGQRRHARPVALTLAAALAVVTSGTAAAVTSGTAAAVISGPAAAVTAGPAGAAMRAACPQPAPGLMRCFAWYRPQAAANARIAAGVPAMTAGPAGLGASDIEPAYKLPVSRDTHQTVAVVDAMSTPNLASDLAVYRGTYGLAPCAAASGCLRIVNQAGKPSPLPPADPQGWGVEETLDVSMVSAACPHCRILVVEATSPSLADLAAAEDTAARLGAQVISNSYGVRESGFSQALARSYDHPGHSIVVSSGDLGFTAANFPANLATVTAVGGTQLTRARSRRGWREQAWHDQFGAGGSGCSAYAAKPAWQHDQHCGMRTIADVSAVATNLAIFDTSLPPGTGPWLTVGGTSASAPLIAGVYALAGNAARIAPGYPYRHPGSLFDLTRGNNEVLTGLGGAACGNDYLCVAKPGYDAPTGLGTPNGTGAF